MNDCKSVTFPIQASFSITVYVDVQYHRVLFIVQTDWR